MGTNLIFYFLILVSCSLVSGQGECLPDDERVDCHPDVNSTEARCLQRGCTWCEPTDPDQNVPLCFYPKTWGYKMVGEPINTGHGFQVELERSTTNTMFGGDANELTVEIDFQSDYRLRVRITDDKPRWEVPLRIDPPWRNVTDNPLYDVRFVNDPVFSFKIIRRETATVIFDSSLGGFNFADQFIQIGFKLPSRNVYGIGENEQPTLRHSFEKRPTWTLFARDQAPDYDANMYGVQPTYTVLEDDGLAHAVAIINSNAMEFEMHPSPGIVYRTIGGLLDMYFFLGPSPQNTASQLSEAIGRFPLPPYWALGFHLCRYGYDHIDVMKATVDRMIASEIPYDVQYGDIDIMHNRLDFTVSNETFPGLAEYVKELKTKGIRFITIQDPAISTVEPPGYRPFELGQEMDVWVKRADGTPVEGTMWSEGPVYYPDYSKNSTKEWWRILINEFHPILEFDALWIDMNEPTNFGIGDVTQGCLENRFNNPPYLPRVVGDDLADKTICPDHVDSVDQHYNTHSLYGWFESEATIGAVREAVGKRTFALSRSTFLGSGRWVTHWLGDNLSRWSNLHTSIIGILQFNLFGMPFIGPDICGHFENSNEQLCQRWQELGAFYPFSRNHNGDKFLEQDPAAFGGAIINSTKKAMTVRYTLLPYLYTLLAHHEMYGYTVARPLWFEFPTDTIARGIDRQFLWGSGVLITPVLDEDQVTVRAYFPDSRFYDYYTGEEVSVRGDFTVLDAPLDHINVHIHGGNVIATQEPAVNTDISRNNPFGLIVALDDQGVSFGRLYYDDAETFDPIQTGNYFYASIVNNGNLLEYLPIRDSYPGMASKVVDTVRLLGIKQTPTRVVVNGESHSEFTVLPSKELFVWGLNLPADKIFALEYA